MKHLRLSCLLLLAGVISNGNLVGQTTADSGSTADLRAKIIRMREKLAQAEGELAALEGRSPDKLANSKSKDGTVPKPDAPPGIIRQVMLRKSVFDQKQVGEPAEINYVRPGSGKDSYAIDAGVSVEFEPLFSDGPLATTIAPRLAIEYHRNSAPASLDDQFQAGLQLEAALGKAGGPFGGLVNFSASFKNDTVADTQSIESTLEFLPLLPWLATDNFQDIGTLRFRWQPFIGLLYESTIDTAADVESGHRLLGRYGAELTVWPFFGKLAERVEMRASYTAWSSLDATGVFSGNDWSAFFETGLTYWFTLPNPVGGRLTDKHVAMGIGVTYQNGDHPELGLVDQDLLTLSFQAKF